MPFPIIRPEPIGDPLGIVRAKVQNGETILENEHRALVNKVTFKWIFTIPLIVLAAHLIFGVFIGFDEEYFSLFPELVTVLMGLVAGGVVDLIRLIMFRKKNSKTVNKD